MFAAHFTINVKLDDLERVLEACIENGQVSARVEPDGYRFAIFMHKNNPNRVRSMEVFKSEQGLEARYETPHFSKMWEIIEDMIDGELGEAGMEFVYSKDGSLGP
jgi:quinol monooxygenase YgiN